MNNLRRAYRMSLLCLGGAGVQLLYGLIATRVHFWEAGNAWMEGFWMAANVGMIGGALGLLWLDVGRPRRLALVGAVLSVLGNLMRIMVSVLILAGFGADTYTPILLSSIPLMLLGMGALGVATLLGRRLIGWQAWAPLLSVGFAILAVSVYSSSQYLHGILLGVWGIPWMLIGAVVFTHATRWRQTMIRAA